MLDVTGVGAVVLDVPPVALVYHFREVPGALSGTAVAFEQYSTGLETPGAPGVAVPVPVLLLRGPSQPLLFVWLT